MSKTSFRSGQGVIRLWQCSLLWAAKQRMLQRFQNYAAKTILDRNKYDSSTLARYQLHSLPVEERIKFKLLTLVHKCLNDQATLYLQKLLEYQESERESRSIWEKITQNSQKQMQNLPGWTFCNIRPKAVE